MQKGGAMLYAVAISFIIAVITSAFILLNYYDRIQHIDYTNSEKAKSNVLSGLKLVMANNSLLPENTRQTIDLFGSGTDSVTLEHKAWGAFEITIAACNYGNQYAKRSIMTGYLADTNIAIYTPENNKTLSLCGKCIIKGTCYLSKSGVKAAYIEGKSFTGNKLIDGAIKKSELSLPPLNPVLLEKLSLQFKNSPSSTDSVIKWKGNAVISDTIINSFYKRTILLENTEAITINLAQLTGNIIIDSKKSITVDARSDLKDVILIAPKIVFKKNFNGIVQAIASDSIIVEKLPAALPSVLITLKEKANTSNSAIIVNSNSSIEGILLAYETIYDFAKPSKIAIAEKSTVYGIIYTNGVVQHKGTISGSVYCQNFVLSTSSAFYENHLLDVTIDATKLSAHFVGTSLFKKNNSKAIVKWLD